MDPVKASSSSSGTFPSNNDPAPAEPGATPPALRDPAQSAGGAPFEGFPASSPALAVRSLLEAYTRPTPSPSAPPPGASETDAASSPSPRTDNNAARTSRRSDSGAYAQAGYTTSGDGVFAGIAALKAHDARSGTDAEAFTASAQFGAQTELQAGLARVGGSVEGDQLDVNFSAEFLTARLNGGIHNDDDSHGANFGGMLTGAGAELTVSGSGWSGTVGLSASLGAAASSGDRNIDGDETPERCFKGSIGALTLGVCTEL